MAPLPSQQKKGWGAYAENDGLSGKAWGAFAENDSLSGKTWGAFAENVASLVRQRVACCPSLGKRPETRYWRPQFSSPVRKCSEPSTVRDVSGGTGDGRQHP